VRLPTPCNAGIVRRLGIGFRSKPIRYDEHLYSGGAQGPDTLSENYRQLPKQNQKLIKGYKMSSVGTQRNTFNDASGRVTVAVFSHQGSPGQAHWNEEEILVGDPDMIAIGGGGTATDVPQGNLLTSSHPND